MKSNDIYTLLSMISRPYKHETLDQWRIRTGLSISSIHRSLKNLKKAKLVVETIEWSEPVHKNVKEFLLHGFQYVFPEEKGKLTRGFATGIDATSLKDEFVSTDYPLVWAHHEGNIKGFSIKPLNSKVPELISIGKIDNKLYQLLALLDAIRVGQSREVENAKRELTKILSEYEQQKSSY